jgi:hypothetical protein
MILDIADPANIRQIGSGVAVAPASHIEVSPDVAGYIVAFIAGTDGLFALSISGSGDLASWTRKSHSGASDLQVAGKRLYVTDGNGLVVYDITNWTETRTLGAFVTRETAGVSVFGSRAYLAQGRKGLLVLDVSDPANIRSLGHHDTVGFARDVAFAEHAIYVADGARGLVEVSSIPGLRFTLSSLGTPGSALTIEASRDLSDPAAWAAIFSTNSTTGAVKFTDFDVAVPAKFYRARQP